MQGCRQTIKTIVNISKFTTKIRFVDKYLQCIDNI